MIVISTAKLAPFPKNEFLTIIFYSFYFKFKRPRRSRGLVLTKTYHLPRRKYSGIFDRCNGFVFGVRRWIRFCYDLKNHLLKSSLVAEIVVNFFSWNRCFRQSKSQNFQQKQIIKEIKKKKHKKEKKATIIFYSGFIIFEPVRRITKYVEWFSPSMNKSIYSSINCNSLFVV